MSVNQHRMTSEERRAAIVEAGVRLFAERGFRGTTTRALAEAVGVTEPVLYEHFKSKRELYAAIVEQKSREGLEKGIALLMPYAEARDDRGFFQCLGQFILQRYRADPAYARLLLFAALEDPELGQLLFEGQQRTRDCLACYIRQRIAEGAFRAVDPAVAARAFLAMFHHHGQVGVLFADHFLKGGRREIVRGMVEIFLKGILADRAPAISTIGRLTTEVAR